MPTTILFLAANPTTTMQLALDEEARAIEEALRGSERRDDLRFVSKWAVRPGDLLQHLNEQRPAIVHFSGHAEPGAGLVLQGETGEPQRVSTASLARLFRGFRDEVRVVVFNACHTDDQAEAVAREIEHVVGMTRAIGDDGARVFASAFYRALGFGREVPAAFEQGCMAIQLAGIPDEQVPRLIRRAGAEATSGPAPAERRARVALLAAAADQAWVGKLKTHLLPLAKQAGLELWDPSSVASGSDWRAQIDGALDGAGTVVVIVSPELFVDEELAGLRVPELLSAAGTSKRLLSLIVSASAFTDTALGRLKPLNPPDLPLDALSPSDLNRRLLVVARDIVASAARAPSP